MIDATYTADALAWLLAWTALGLAGRELLVRHDARKSVERSRQHAGKAGR